MGDTALTTTEQKERDDLLKALEKKIAIALVTQALLKVAKGTAVCELVADVLKQLGAEHDLCEAIIRRDELRARDGYHGPRLKQPIPKELRWLIWERDNFTCHYCGSRRNLTVDHKHPEKAGGTLDSSNLLTACKTCNCRKRTKSYEQFMQEVGRGRN